MTRRIVIDSREQKPYTFPEGECVTRALPSGDYSLEGLEEIIAIERKSLADWVNTIVHNHRRFSAELIRLRSYKYAAVVIECNVDDILAHRYHSDIAPQALLNKTAGIMLAYAPVGVVFAGSRPQAKLIVERLLRLGEKRYGSECNNTAVCGAGLQREEDNRESIPSIW